MGCRAKRRRYDPSKGRLLDALEPYWSCAERHPVKWLLQGGIVRRCVLLTLSVLCLSGCTTTSTYRPNALAPLTRGSIDTFVALVSSSSGQPRCKKPVDAPLGPGANAVAWVFPRPLEQQITVVLDAAGTPTRYVDVRGDLSPSDDSVADRTTIVLYPIGTTQYSATIPGLVSQPPLKFPSSMRFQPRNWEIRL